MVNGDQPFVLLDDARPPGAAALARLYQAPVEIIEAYSASEVDAALERLDAARRDGLYAAGYLSYGAGHIFEPKLAARFAPEATPSLWFGLFESYTAIASADVPKYLPAPEAAWIGKPAPRISRRDYDTALAIVQAYIAAGDIYQANLTFPCDVALEGHPLSIYAGLRGRAKSGYGGVVYTGKDWLLSLSPELFFTLENNKLTTKPMKGTAARHATPELDAAAMDNLQSDPKQRAENLMIVDLLRNDFARVAEPGSVKVPALFEIESYPTVHQMTSTITAALRSGLNATDVLRATFPCGSITGAPKIRAMEVIAEVERAPRGVYTGSIGRIDPSGDAAFNVAIRTLQIGDGAHSATLGLGSGIVADSNAASEWQECLDKGAFVASPITFDLIETMRFDPDGGITLLDGHIARLAASAKQFGIPFNRHDVGNALQAATIRHAGIRKLRLMLSRSGGVAIEIGPLPPKPDGVVEVAVVPLPVDIRDVRLSHKTTDRAFYDEARRASGAFEVLFTDPSGHLTEGSFTNIFVPRDGLFLTPPLSRGLLPGVFRAELVARGAAIEADLTIADLRNGFFIGNALRGLLSAKLKT
jgi:para-aminobenzoate synthetase/4-amino-4-deoxychorismate lyase